MKDVHLKILLVFGLIAGIDSQKLSTQYTQQISTGVYISELQGPVFYESYFPLIYEYQVPVYKTLDVTLRDWRSKCENDNYSPSYTCPTFYHFEKFLEKIEQEVVPRAWIDPASNKSTGASTILSNHDFCNKIQSHFKGSLTQEFSFEEYVNNLKICDQKGNSSLIIERQISNYVYNIKALFKRMNDNYENEFSNKFFGEANKKIGPAFYVSAVTSHQNGMVTAYLLEKGRWTSAQIACHQKRIPESLLKTANVTKYIKDLNIKLNIANKHTALDVGELSSIYKLPLTDCSFIERTGHFVVRTLIPTISKNISPKLFKINNVPFYFENKMCQLNLKTKGINHFIYDDTSKQLHYSDCTEEQALCQVKAFEDTVTDLCIKSVFEKDVSAVKRYCGDEFNCAEIPQEDKNRVPKPLVQQVSSDVWVLSPAGALLNASSKTTIKCKDGHEDLAVNLTEELTGALEIKLPCGCQMVYDSVSFQSSRPCVDEYNQHPQIRQIISSNFLQQDFLSKLQQATRHGILLTNLTLNASSFDPKFLITDPHEISGEQSAHTQEDQENNNNSSKTVPNSDADQKVPHTHDSDEGQSKIGLLWTLVIFQLFLLLTIIGFGTYRYVKFRKALSYSKERLVYNIYASPSDPNISESSANPAYRSTTSADYMNHL